MNISEIYYGSDGQATMALYDRLKSMGPRGMMAMNLFRACKCSARAKVYRGGIPGKGSYRGMAYERKQWSLNLLCAVLEEQAAELGIAWGWKQDPLQPVHSWVLYVEIPTGQVSFHSQSRGKGPDYAGEWDGQHASAERIIEWTQSLVDEEDNVAKN